MGISLVNGALYNWICLQNVADSTFDEFTEYILSVYRE